MLPQLHVKDPGHSATKASGRLHLNPHMALTRRSRSGLTMVSRQSVTTYQGNELTRTSSGNVRPQSSQRAEPLWTESGVRVEMVRAR